MKKCEECFWRRNYIGKNTDSEKFCAFDKKKSEDICKYFDYTCTCCKDEQAIVMYKGNTYCKECIISELNIQTYTIEHYQTEDGEYLGDDSEDFESLLENNFKYIKTIEEF
ncbi:Uncharacterised protein [[Clostridium] sordellii]|uniref:Uncharacterized protein n=1 Tax=Paraclostridium sordellii TaxID=1505 RepID=A0A0C7QKP1_PARSO|nr:hypothetical protein [Paeniclostridium sordellii]CEQ04101.1 Uncharacterised protein [[Clostridium] sordellii] [Paeniclostridium sordellii]